MKNTKRWSNHKASILLGLVLLLAALVGLSGVTLSGYATGVDSTDGAHVARYAFSVTDGTNVTEQKLDLSAVKQPGDSTSCVFTVTNRDTNGICEVTQDYTINVETAGNLPLTYRLSRNDNPAIGYAATTNPALYSHEEMTLPCGDETSHTYTLTIEWPADEKAEAYANGVASVKLRIRSEQVAG